MSYSWFDYGRWLDASLFAGSHAPSFDIATIQHDGAACPVEETVVDSVPFCSLRRFARPQARGAPPSRIFLCAPLAGHHAVMLRETVETLLQDGDVYITDWQDARTIPVDAGPLNLDDYVATLERFVTHAQREAGTLHLIAVCQAAPPALAAAALLADARAPSLASITLIGGPIDARLQPTALERFAMSHDLAWFRALTIDVVPECHAGAMRRVYPGYLQRVALFNAHPERLSALRMRCWLSAMHMSTEPLQHARRALEEYTAVLDMPEAYFLDTIRVIFHDALLARGLWRIGDRKVSATALDRTPLCTIEGDRDDITGQGQTHAAHALCTSADAPRRRFTIENCNHYDLFTGSRWHDAVHPALVDFWRSLDSGARSRPTHRRIKTPGAQLT